MIKDQTKQGSKCYPLTATRYTLYDRVIEFCLIFLIIFTPLAYGAVEPWGIAVFEVTAAVMALVWFFKMLKSGVLEFVKTSINVFIFLFITYILLQLIACNLRPGTKFLSSVICHLSSVYGWATKTELLKVISYTLIFFVTLNTIKTKRQMIRILSVIIAAGFMMSMFYMIRYFGVKAPYGFINSDHFSAYLGMIIPLALGFLFASYHSPVPSHTNEYRASSIEYRILLFFTVIVMSAALFFTMSRGGMFSFIASLLFMSMLISTKKSIKKKGWILSAVAICIIMTISWLGATPIVEEILNTKAEITERYFGGRLPIWQGTLEIIRDHLIFGTGLGTFNYIFPKYQPAEIISKHYSYAHSDVLELLSEVGIVGFSLFLVFGFCFSVWLFKNFNRRHDPWIIGMSIGFFGSLTSIFLHSFTDFNLHIPANAILLTILLSLFIVILNLGHKAQVTGHKISRGGKSFFYPITALLAGIFIFISAKPAIANYYFQKATSYKLQDTSYKTQMNPMALPAIRYTLNAIKLDPTNAKYHYELGKLYAKQITSHTLTGTGTSPVTSKEQLNKAISEYQKAIELNPTNSKYHQGLAWTYSQFADLPNLSICYSLLATNNAKKHFQQAIQLEPNNPYRHRAYAIWLFNHPAKENINKGVKAYRKTVELNPNLAKEALEKYFTVEKKYRQLKTILPDTPEAHYEVISLLLDAGLWEQNEIDFKEDMKQASYKYPYYKAISGYYVKNKNIEKSIEALEDYLKIDPNCAEAHFYLADRLIYKKPVDWELFFKEIEKALELEPENEWYRYWYAVRLFRIKKYREADEQFNRVVALNPKYSHRIQIFKSSKGEKAE